MARIFRIEFRADGRRGRQGGGGGGSWAGGGGSSEEEIMNKYSFKIRPGRGKCNHTALLAIHYSLLQNPKLGFRYYIIPVKNNKMQKTTDFTVTACSPANVPK